jgi:FAD/FMN-containing dehydrogenase
MSSPHLITPLLTTQVTFAVKHHIPIVAKSGGHSPWSTVASPGWIIDLSLFTGVKLDTQKHTATVQAGVGTKQLNAAVSEAGFCIQSPGASTVGYIPFLLGGGSTWLTGMYGLAVDNLISARVITATRGLVTASASENADLFWALKGAGQFFGLVTAVTAQIFPLEQKITAWTCIFLPAQMKDVAKVVAALANGDDSAKSPGMAAVLAAPGQTKVDLFLPSYKCYPFGS